MKMSRGKKTFHFVGKHNTQEDEDFSMELFITRKSYLQQNCFTAF